MKLRYENYQFPFMGGEKAKLLREGEELFRRMGIDKGKTVVDFGSGPGAFTIPIARLLGENGKIYAVDKNESYLRDLEEMAKNEGLKNIEIVKVGEEVALPFPSACVDIFLLFDVLHHINWDLLFPEVKRVLKPDGKVCVYPHHHLSKETLPEALGKYGLVLKEIIEGAIFIFKFSKKFTCNI
ncbi:class I SAM-dependent methyltransferase [bacterium]|nr:class I SAM-dependent methyltransferase [bacterium]